MSVPIDINAVIAPIAGSDPVGVDLRAAQDKDFAGLRERVDEAQRRRRMLERGEQSPPPDWPGVATASADLLARKAKDIQILGWMIEAATRAYGLEGLAAAMESAAKIIEQFLPSMYPRVEQGDEEFRLRPLIGLDNNGSGTLIPLIQQQPVISIPDVNGQGNFTILHQQQALLVEKLDAEKKEQRVRGGAVTLDQISRAAARMTPAQASATFGLLNRAIKGTESLRDGLLKHCGADAPPTSAILDSLQSCRAMLLNYAKDKANANGDSMSQANGQPGTEMTAASSSPSSNGRPTVSIGSVAMEREAILSAIGRLVSAFDSLEPQNLAVPALQQAIAWARMDRVALLSDLLGNATAETARDKLFRLLGLKAPAEEKSEG